MKRNAFRFVLSVTYEYETHHEIQARGTGDPAHTTPPPGPNRAFIVIGMGNRYCPSAMAPASVTPTP